MSENSLLIKSLKEKLPESCWAWIIPALHHDPIIWESLNTHPLQEKVFSAFVNPEDWTPVNIGFLSLDARPPRIAEPFDGDFSGRSEEEYNAFLVACAGNPEEYQPDISRVTLIAAALREQFNRDRSWKSVLIPLWSAPLISHTIRVSWQAIFTILLGFLNDPFDLLKFLGGSDSPSGAVSIAVHACLSNPQPPSQFENKMKLLLADLGLPATSRWLNKLSRFRREESARLARWVLNKWFHAGNIDQTSFQDEPLDALNQNLALAQLLFLAGRHEEADNIYSQALRDHQRIADTINTHKVECNLISGGIEAGIPTWHAIVNQPKANPPHSLLIAAGEKDIDAALDLLEEDSLLKQSPARFYLEAVQAARQNRFSEARNSAYQALTMLEATASEPGAIDSKELVMVLTWLGNFLLNLSYPQAALRAFQLAHILNPDDTSISRLLATAASLAGVHETAINAAQLATAAQPANPELRRELAAIYEVAGEWKAGLAERELLIDRRFAPPSEPDWPSAADWRELAACAVQAGDLHKAQSACFKALEMSPEDGLTQGILGEISLALGEKEQAINHLVLATQQTPDRPEPWLALAKYYTQSGQREKAIETLRSAVNTVDDNPLIHVSLAEHYLEDRALTQAEASLSRAYQSMDQMEVTPIRPPSYRKFIEYNGKARSRHEVRTSIAYLYGLTLLELGKIDKALNVLADIYSVHPSYPDLAYTYGRALLEMNEPWKAISPLAVAVTASPLEPGPYLDYAFALSTSKEQPDLVIQNLSRAISLLERSLTEGHKQDAEQSPSRPSSAPGWIHDKPEWKYGFITNKEFSEAGEDQIPMLAQGLAVALLAEAYETSGHHESAIRMYSQGLESDLAKDESWNIRLSLGMARVALQMAQPEIAIAALQDASRKEIDNIDVYKILSEAYSAIDLNEEALQACRQAVQLAPDNVEILSWFAEKAVDLGVTEAAIPPLVRAVEIDPKRTDLAIRLAGIFLNDGKKREAHELLIKILSNPDAAPDDLFKAAAGLSSLGDDKNAAACLERALELQPDPPLQLLTELTSAYHAEGEDELALRTIEIAVDRYADHPEVHKIKAEILTSLGRLQAAQASLEHAMVLAPTDPVLQYQLARLLIDQGRLIEARELTRKMVEFIDGSQIDRFTLKALEFAADIARSVLDLDSARAILSKVNIESVPVEQLTGIVSGLQEVDFFCLKAELALDADEEIAAAAVVNQIVRAGLSHPRVLALQARLSWRQGDSTTAGQFFSSVFEAVSFGTMLQGKDLPTSTNSIVGAALAAIDLGMWDQSVDLLTTHNGIRQPSPYISVQFARSIILKEEFLRLCKGLNVINHIPAQNTSIADELQAALRALQSVKDSLPDDLLENQPVLLRRWLARCQALLHPGPEAVEMLQGLPPDPSDQAALISTLAQLDDLVAISQIFRSLQNQYAGAPIHHLILAQFAYAIGLKGRRQNDIDESIQAARAAIDQKPDQPLYYVILARLSQANGDLKTAIDAYQTALSFWPDEPRWHASAAKVALASGDIPAAIDHLNQAIALEPAHIPHHLALGEAHLRIGNPNQAVSALEHVLEIAPSRIEAHLALASAQLACGRMKEAAETAKKAISLAPNEISPLLLGADIHLKTGEPEQTKQYAEAALKLKPEDPAASYLLSRALEQLGRPEESLRVIEKALPNAADPIPLLLQRAKLVGYSQGDSAAFTALQELSNQYPDEPYVLAELAKSLAKSGNQDQAIQTAQRALRSGNGHLSPEDRADLHYLLGTLLRQTGQLDQAVHQLSEAARQSPQNPEIYLDLGELLQERRQHGKAIETFRKAISLAPDDPRPYLQIGVALRDSHDYQAAETMLRRAAELAPKDVSIRRQLAALIALNLVHNNR